MINGDPDKIWQQFLLRDAELEKLLEERANLWISVKDDPVKEKEAIERIEKEFNPEIDRVSEEVKGLLAAHHLAKGGGDEN